MKPKYQRILLKLSGEALMGDDAFGINRPTIERIVGEIKEVADMGVAMGIVIGVGNIFRGVSTSAAGMDRATDDTWACWPLLSIHSRCRTRFQKRV